MEEPQLIRVIQQSASARYESNHITFETETTQLDAVGLSQAYIAGKEQSRVDIFTYPYDDLGIPSTLIEIKSFSVDHLTIPEIERGGAQSSVRRAEYVASLSKDQLLKLELTPYGSERVINIGDSVEKAMNQVQTYWKKMCANAAAAPLVKPSPPVDLASAERRASARLYVVYRVGVKQIQVVKVANPVASLTSDSLAPPELEI